MATAEEILAGMAEETVEETLEIVIDESLQKMIIPPGLTHLGVAGDDSVKTLYFRCPKMHGKYDLSEFEIFVSYTNEGAAGGILPVSNKVINDSDMTFECELEGDAFLYKGFTVFALNMRLYDEDYIPIKKFNTEPEKLPVKEGMDNGENFFERYPDIIQQLLDEIADLKENGVGTGGTARSIQFQVYDNIIQYRYEGDTEWVTLFDMNTLPSVQYTAEQKLTDAQKARARMNMGAVGIAHDEWQDGNIPIFDAYSTYLEGDAMVRDSGIPINKIEEATNAVPTHNTSSESHNDIRLLIQNVQKALEAFLDIDDESMNQATEFVAYMKDNRELIEQVTTNKVSVSDIVDDYVTNVSNKPVSAAVAVKLKALIDAIAVPTKTSQLTNDSRFVTEDITNQLSEEIVDKLPINQGAENVGKILVVGTDGKLTLTDMPEGGTSGDVVGVLDESNNILLSGNLADGTYTLVFVDEEGNTTGAGTLEVDAIPEPAEPVTVDIALTDGIRIGSDGTDRTQTGYCATPHIDLTNIPKPCTINLTKALWCHTASQTSGMVRVYAKKADGTQLISDTTRTDVGSGYFTVVDNSGIGNDVTVTITSDDVGYIRFSGGWTVTGVSDSYGSFADANTKATLTYTPKA